MTIAIKCECGEVLKTKVEHAGRRVKCPACGLVVRMTAAQGTGQPPAPPVIVRQDTKSDPPPSQVPTPKKKAGSQAANVLGTALGAVLLLIGLFLFFILAVGGGGIPIPGLILASSVTLAGGAFVAKGFIDMKKAA